MKFPTSHNNLNKYKLYYKKQKLKLQKLGSHNNSLMIYNASCNVTFLTLPLHKLYSLRLSGYANRFDMIMIQNKNIANAIDCL